MYAADGPPPGLLHRMLVRTVVSIVNLGVFSTALALIILVPSIGLYLSWALIPYFIASILLFRMPAMSRPIGGGRRPTAPSPGSPLPSGSTPANLGGLGFCAYCGTHLTPGTAVCPACGRTVPPA